MIGHNKSNSSTKDTDTIRFIHQEDSEYGRTREETIIIYTKLDKDWKEELKIAEEMLREEEKKEGVNKDKTNLRISALDFHIM